MNDSTYNIVDVKNLLVKVNDGREILEGETFGHIFMRLDAVEEAIISAAEYFKGKTYVEIRPPVED